MGLKSFLTNLKRSLRAVANGVWTPNVFIHVPINLVSALNASDYRFLDIIIKLVRDIHILIVTEANRRKMTQHRKD